MIFFYKIITILFYPLIILLIFYRKLRGKEDSERYKEKIFKDSFNVHRNKEKKLIWFHSASIGELKSIIPIIEELNKKHTNLDFLVTTLTVSAANLAKTEFKNTQNIQHRFFPADVSFLIKKFLFLWKPSLIFLVDSEIWPNLIFNVKKTNIPLILINARITSKSFRRWKLVSSSAKKIFSSFDLCLSSNLETQEYLKELGANKISYYGNLKLISRYEENSNSDLNEKILKNSNFWCAISTHEGEEDFCLKVHTKLKENFKNSIMLLAPRHINRINEVKKICNKYNLDTQIINKNELIKKDKEIVLINSFGMLSNFLKHSSSVFVGKSLIKKLKPVGGQNPIEAAKFGCKIFHGPYVYNFQEIYDLFKKNNISKEIADVNHLADEISKNFKSEKSENLQVINFINKLGEETLKRTLEIINPYFTNENTQT